MKNSSVLRLFSTSILLFGGSAVFAHVKWFSQYSYMDEPLQMVDVANPIFWLLAISSMIVVGVLAVVNNRIQLASWYKNTIYWLGNYKGKSLLIMRIAAGVVFLMSWELGTLIMPELTIESGVLRWFQFLLAVLLLFRVTVPLAGVGMFLAFGIGIYQFGLFHMLDYLLLPGIAYFFLISNSEKPIFKNSGLLLLYMTLGFSLCWAGMEKLIYPFWGTSLLEQHPNLALGLDEGLFIQGAAFIEISVGIMFMLGFFQRILAATVTLLFILTTLVFGEVEVTGHLLIHATLIIFIIEGSGKVFDVTPVFYRRIGRNPILTGLSFALLLITFVVPYAYAANLQYNKSLQVQLEEHPGNIEITDSSIAPKINVKVVKDKYEGWTINLATLNFELQAPNEAVSEYQGNGYATLSINGKLTDRIYGSAHYLSKMEPGSYDIEVYLFSAKHEQLTHLGLPIKANYELIIE